jgi:hypothetical protein
MPFNPYDHNASYSDVTEGFVFESRRNLLAALGRIEHCLNQLSEEQVWWRPAPAMNAIGNLLLHLDGNVGQWIIAAVEGSESTRNRPAEFAQREPIAPSELLARLSTTVSLAAAAIASIASAEQLLERRRIQGNDTTVLTAIYHSVAHFEGHTQEIIGMTRQLKGEAYQFLWTPATPEQASAAARP